MLPFLPPNYQRVLEVGCGAGAFYECLKQGIEYWGVDPSASAELAMGNRASEFFRGGLEDVAGQLPNQYFDLIIINDVMEHSIDHLAFLGILKSKLAAGGVLVGSVPNVRYILNLKDLLLHKDWAYQASGGVLDYTHLRFFTQKSLRQALSDAGFDIEACAGINPVWWSRHPSRALAKKMFYGACAMTLGRDIPYLQFAFRCKI